MVTTEYNLKENSKLKKLFLPFPHFAVALTLLYFRSVLSCEMGIIRPHFLTGASQPARQGPTVRPLNSG